MDLYIEYCTGLQFITEELESNVSPYINWRTLIFSIDLINGLKIP